MGMSDWSPDSQNLKHFKEILMEDYESTPFIAPEAELIPTLWQEKSGIVGRLVGGNLTVFVSMMGTPYFPTIDDETILFFEGARKTPPRNRKRFFFLSCDSQMKDINEPPYKIDRLLTQLKLGGILDMARGIVFGKFSLPADWSLEENSFTVDDVLLRHCCDLKIPAIKGAQIGHIAQQWIIPIGSEVFFFPFVGMIDLIEPCVVVERLQHAAVSVRERGSQIPSKDVALTQTNLGRKNIVPRGRHPACH
jgi:muramoyltetrapeptide carboxypeptidase LdcA involved in peptidoglycan recycling